ncbi:MAG: polyphosphate kinase 2 family protein [Anaerolineales bacterium]|nr:polyphosphate kinase 2 family protein [Anaerolineales bacterium]
MKSYQVKVGSKVDLNKWDPDGTHSYDGDKDSAKAAFARLNQKLERFQEILYAEHKHKLLIVLQARDTGGKDSTIRRVFEHVNPQGVKVASFKVPTDEEMDHDYLWRVHKVVPGKGMISIFNRSHYEDVLVVRVHNLVPQKIWEKRYEHINHFEEMLADEGTTILKFYLHIDKDEQKKRLQARLEDPEKHWKFSLGDLDERKLWGEYTKAYETMLEKTSTGHAPWYIIPANRKWYRDLIIANILVQTLEKLDMKYPEQTDDLSNVIIE